ncbi:tryptophan synthase subunit alpha [Thioalkalivibrio sp. HK1]|uniref:tryptophan synthase subunit alpha n=1 Tax=Thioalkalivibrio sp. HK1 TaxID=1469245 RepID=UPI000472AD58|nr:tryptophan synthase subunit alpha [Thioalkalivibrio sp. HK1]
MSRIARRFESLAERGRTALIPFVTAGDPDASTTLTLMHEMVDAGADILELGIPFSDPMADGPVIQRAGERALAAGMHFEGVLDIVRAFRKRDRQTPVVLMGYLNPLEAAGGVESGVRAAAAGADGFIVVDLPPEEAQDFAPAVNEAGIDTIFLLSPTSNDERIARICALARGFVYYVSLRGITGAAGLDAEEVAQRVAHIKAMTDLPVGVGFGIRSPEDAAKVARVADAVVVGSAIVSRIEEAIAGQSDASRGGDRSRAIGDAVVPVVVDFVADLRAAIDKIDGVSADAHASTDESGGGS